MISFLEVEMPEYLIVCDALEYRPFLARSFLRGVAEALEVQDEVQVGGMMFTKLSSYAPVDGMAACTMLVKVEYGVRGPYE